MQNSPFPGPGMTKAVYSIIPMVSAHIDACESIIRVSDPWKRLGERVDFQTALTASGKAALRAFVCTIAGETAGFILFTPEPVFARGGYLRAIGVAPGHRGQGIGGKLLSFAEKMTSQHALHMFLCASSFNKEAQAFYKKYGYQKVGKLKDFILPGASEYIYWKRLKTASGRARRPRSCRPGTSIK